MATKRYRLTIRNLERFMGEVEQLFVVQNAHGKCWFILPTHARWVTRQCWDGCSVRLVRTIAALDIALRAEDNSKKHQRQIRR